MGYMTETVEQPEKISALVTAQVGRNVRAAMKTAEPRVLQADVADWLKLSQGAVWKRLEGLTPWGIGELIVVARRLGVPVATLLEGTDEVAA
jgi:hypothetical protein